MANTWGQSGTTWGQNQWSEQTQIDVPITAPSQLTTALGTVTPFNELGWGSDNWGFENWGESGLDVSLTGVSATTAVGTLSVVYYPGWGTLDWGENGWGSVNAGKETLPAFPITMSLGTLTTLVETPVVITTSLEMTGTVAPLTPFHDSNLTLTNSLLATASLGTLGINAGDDVQIGLTAFEMTGSLGTVVTTDGSVQLEGGPGSIHRGLPRG